MSTSLREFCSWREGWNCLGVKNSNSELELLSSNGNHSLQRRKQIFVFSVTRCGEFWREAKGGSSCNNRTSSRRQVWNGPLFHCSRCVCVCEAVWGHQPYSQLWVHRTICRLPWASSTWHAVCRTISSNHRFPICKKLIIPRVSELRVEGEVKLSHNCVTDFLEF